jgi:RNA polymerase sigma-70 factor (ECF subfamily)
MLSDDRPNSGDDSSQHRPFATTHWSVVVAAGRPEDPAAQEALATLCTEYWYPLYAYVRRRGFQAAEAQDLTQGFIVHLLEHNAVQAADQARGRFRAFLLSSLHHFLANQWRHDQAEKRGGGRIRSLDLADGERRYLQEPADLLTPERIYERRWAMTLLQKAVAALRSDYEASGKGDLFETLKAYLGGNAAAVPYRDLAEQLGTSEGALKVAIHRLRQRCRECLRRTIGDTVASPADIDEELRFLFQVVEA